MTDAPERIWAVIGYAKGTDIRGEFASSVTSFWRDQKPVSYILATPEALASSPEVAALIAEARLEGWKEGWGDACKQTLTHFANMGVLRKMWDASEITASIRAIFKGTTHD